MGGLFLGYSLFIDEGLEGFPSIDASDTVGQNAHLFGSNNLQHILSAGLDAVVSSDSADIDAISIAEPGIFNTVGRKVLEGAVLLLVLLLTFEEKLGLSG